MAAIIL